MFLKRAAGPALLILLTIAVYWKILLTDQYTWLNSPDFAYQVAPWFQFQAAQWHQGHFPLWDPHHLAGQSLIGQMQPGVVYPLNWLLFLAPLKDGFIRQAFLHWYFAIIHMMAAVFAYAFCRDLGRSKTASILGGAVFAFGGYVGTTEWPQMLNGAVWAPLILLYSFRAFRGERVIRNAALSGLFLGVAYLSGHHQIPTFLMLTVAGLWIAEIVRQRQRLVAFLVLIAAAFCISAPQTLPAYAYGKDSVRWVGAERPVTWKDQVPYSIHAQFSLAPHEVLGTFIPGVFTHSNPYVGLPVLALAVAGVALLWRERMVKLLVCVAAGGLLLALAGNTIVHGLLYALIPNVEKARNPAMAALVFCLAAATLAAFGLDALDAVWRRRLALAAGIVAALGWTLIAVVSIVKTPLTIDADRFAMALITATTFAAVLAGTRSAALLVLIAMVEVASLPGAGWASKEQGQPMWTVLSRDADVAAFLRSRPQPIRVDINDTDVPYNFGDWYGIDTFAGGYFASMPARIYDKALWDDRAKAQFGVNLAVAKAPPREGMRELFTSAAGLKVFEVPDAFPRVWSIHDAAGLNLEACGQDEVRLASYEVRKSIIQAHMNCRGLVILGDGYSPDWKAKIDGKRVPLQAPGGILRGVVVEKGSHTVEIYYHPAAFYWGAGLASAAMIAIAALAVLM